MNISVFVVANYDNSKWIMDNYKNLSKQFFKLGLDISQFAICEDLLGIDYKAFSKGLTIFIEDENKKASSLLVPLNHMVQAEKGIYLDSNNNYIVINTEVFSHFDTFKKVVFDNLKLSFDNFCIKSFGISKQNLHNYLTEYKKSNNIFDFYLDSNFGDNLIIFRFLSTIDSKIKDNVVSNFVKDLNKSYYASKDIDLATAALEILNIRNKSISVCETLTNGLITYDLKNRDSIGVLVDSSVFSNKKAVIKTTITPQIGKNAEEVSTETAYKLATNILAKSSSDIVIVCIGYGNLANSKLSGTYFTAIGDKQAVNVYEHKISGNDNYIINYAKNSSIFELIKKLRQNALNISNYAV